MAKLGRRFILVDDDLLTNLLSKKILIKNLGDIEVKDFVIPELALKYIETEFQHEQSKEKNNSLFRHQYAYLNGMGLS